MLVCVAHRERLLTAYETLLIAPLVLNGECAAALKLVTKLDSDRLDCNTHMHSSTHARVWMRQSRYVIVRSAHNMCRVLMPRCLHVPR